VSRDQQAEGSGPTIERFRDGWVLVDASGAVLTPRPVDDAKARAYAGLAGIPLPPARREDRRG
jgi:hypothetical protein